MNISFPIAILAIILQFPIGILFFSIPPGKAGSFDMEMVLGSSDRLQSITKIFSCLGRLYISFEMIGLYKSPMMLLGIVFFNKVPTSGPKQSIIILSDPMQMIVVSLLMICFKQADALLMLKLL